MDSASLLTEKGRSFEGKRGAKLSSQLLIQDVLGTQAFSGIIQVKPWTKSAQSYSAGGSNYFILSFAVDGQTQDIILRVDPSKLPEICGKSQTLSSTVTALSDLAKRKVKVKVTGNIRKEHIDNPPDDATYQAPVTVGSNDIGTLVIHNITSL